MADEGIFGELDKLNVKNRCMGYNKEGKRCRTRLRKTQYLFCCDAHKPHNQEIIEDGCFCCTEKLINHKEILYFRCKHAVHRKCYYEWMEASQSEIAICMLCRSPIVPNGKYVEDENGVLVHSQTMGNIVNKKDFVSPIPDEDKPMTIITKVIEESMKPDSEANKQYRNLIYQPMVQPSWPLKGQKVKDPS